MDSINIYALFSLSNLKLKEVRIFDKEKITPKDIEFGFNFYTEGDLGKQRSKIIERKLSKIGLNIVNLKEINNDSLDGIDLVIVASDTFSPELHDYWNEFCVKNNKTWLGARYLGNYGEIGPTVIPFKSPCFKCYQTRIESNTEYLDEYRNFKHYIISKKENYGGLKIFYQILGNYLALEIIRNLTNYDTSVTLGNVLLFDFKNFTVNADSLLKVPYCSVCGKI